MPLGFAERREWLASGSSLRGVGIFGAEVERLRPVLTEAAPAERFILHSDQALVGLSRSHGRALFDSWATAERLGAVKLKDDLEVWLGEQRAAHPQQTEWIEARSYWLACGIDNSSGLLGWLAARSDSSIQSLAAKPRAALRFYQGGQIRKPQALSWEGQALVAIVDHGHADRAGDRALNDRLCLGLEQKGLACLSLFAAWGRGTVAALRWLQAAEHPPLAAIIA